MGSFKIARLKYKLITGPNLGFSRIIMSNWFNLQKKSVSELIIENTLHNISCLFHLLRFLRILSSLGFCYVAPFVGSILWHFPMLLAANDISSFNLTTTRQASGYFIEIRKYQPVSKSFKIVVIPWAKNILIYYY